MNVRMRPLTSLTIRTLFPLLLESHSRESSKPVGASSQTLDTSRLESTIAGSLSVLMMMRLTPRPTMTKPLWIYFGSCGSDANPFAFVAYTHTLSHKVSTIAKHVMLTFATPDSPNSSSFSITSSWRSA